MQILSLYIDRYNHLENFTINFKKPISVIIGANGSGKSSILEILAKIFSAAFLNEKSPLGFELLYSVTHENKEERTSTTSDFQTHIVRLSSTGKEEPIKMDTGVLPDGFIISDLKEGKVQLTEQDKSALLRFLPSNVVIYYSGLSDHMEKLCSKHEKIQKDEFFKGNALAKRPMFYYRPENFKMLILALLSFEFGDTKEFVFEKLNITELSSFSIKVKKPDAKWAKGKKAKDVWGAYGVMKNFVAVLEQFAENTIIADDDNSIKFSFPNMERLYSIKNHFGEEKRLFELLDMALYEEMLDEISISLNKGNLQTNSIQQEGEIPLNTEALSEGEQQIIAIKGINEILIQENTLLLFDEPDTYLHPVWQSSFISEIEQYSENAQFIITTHSPQMINNFKEGELHILRKGELIEHSNDFYGRDINSILESYMGAEIRPDETQTTIDEISNLISEKKYLEAKEKLELLNKNDAEYIRLSTKLNFILS
jgi:predicted ATPase